VEALVAAPFGRSLAGSAVLVTGASGVVGSALCAALLDGGATVVALGRADRPGSAFAGGGTAARCMTVIGDIRDEDLLTAVLREHDCRAAFHLAAQPLAGADGGSPRPTFEVNVAGTWSLLEACRAAGTERIVVASTGAVYGAAPTPHSEATALLATEPYAASKAAADLAALAYAPAFGMQVATARLANVYGPGDVNRSRLIPSVVAAALAGRAPVLRAPAGTSRDLLFADDAAQALLAVGDLLAAGEGAGQPFNVGTGEPRAIGEVAGLVCRLAGADVEPEERGTGVPDDRRLDTARLRAATGWTPRVSLEDGLRRTIAWQREHPA
jgi:CDP-glucose 4,6-dehydratase